LPDKIANSQIYTYPENPNKMKNPLYRNIVLGCLLIPSAACKSLNSTEKQNPSRPNVIFILADDLGIGDLGVYGQKILTTPALDKMAADGMYFTNMYCGSTVCAPSRASLMTGKHTGNCSVRGNKPQQSVADNEITLAKVFKEAGYVTGAVGKWGVGRYMPVDDPQRKGFDYFYGYINMFHAHNFYPEFLYENGNKVMLNNKTMRVNGEIPWETDSVNEGRGVAEIRNQYTHDLFDRKALDFIEKNRNDPFFLYLAYNVPHANNEKSDDGMEVDDYYEFAHTDWPQPEKGFAAMIRNLDNSVGMIRSKLEELKIDKNTLIIFCSDNGPHREGKHKVEFFDSNGEYRGSKRDLYEGGIRSPFIAYWPEAIKPGRVSDQQLAFWDFLPTFAALTGAPKPEGTDGINFLPELLGKKQKEQHDYLYWEFYELGGKQAIIMGDWKLVLLNVSDSSKERVFELYNLISDPGETKNLANEFPDKVEELQKMMTEARTEFSVIPLL
jgi:arylsulfatase A-like enzyme